MFSFALLFFSILAVTQIRGHIAGPSPPLMGARIYEILILCYEGQTQIVQTNRKLSEKNSSKWETT